MVYYTEKIQIKVSRGQWCPGQSPADTQHRIPTVVFQCSHTDSAVFSQPQCVTHVQDTACKGPPPSPHVQRSSGGLVLYVWSTWWLTLGTKSPAPSRGQTDTGRSKVSTIHHLVSKLAWPKASGIQRHCYQAEYYQSTQLIFQKLVEVLFFFLQDTEMLPSPS